MPEQSLSVSAQQFIKGFIELDIEIFLIWFHHAIRVNFCGPFLNEERDGSMLDNHQIHAASDFLFQKWSALERIDELPIALRPNSRSKAYAIQSGLERHSASPLFGWKIAATSLAGQNHIGVSGPMAGRILSEKVLLPKSQISLTANLMHVAEVEFAFKMNRDLAPRASAYTTNEVIEAVASLHPAIEIPDSRYNDFVAVGEYQLIADNACAHLFILGEATDFDWRSIDLSHYTVQVKHRHGQQDSVLSGLGANVLGDPRLALTWLVNELSSIGVTLAKGQVVTTGTCLTPVPVVAGDHIDADFGLLGSISASFT